MFSSCELARRTDPLVVVFAAVCFCFWGGGGVKGGGFQASMGGDAFDVLLRHLGVKMECFASPFNCRYFRYCSAFKDTDKPFGRCAKS